MIIYIFVFKKKSREFVEKKTGTGIDQRDSRELPFPEFPCGSLFSTSVICKDALLPILKIATASKTPNFSFSKPTKRILGTRSQIMALKDSLAFCVNPWRHIDNRLSSLKSL